MKYAFYDIVIYQRLLMKDEKVLATRICMLPSVSVNRFYFPQQLIHADHLCIPLVLKF